ncbi:putative histidine kinase [Pseudoalteromonas luteoviolacea B = ATCC 29581]|nr:putative histidine kinase [Pseudoalteromonas luteoviolacea B = ATCC 29581]
MNHLEQTLLSKQYAAHFVILCNQHGLVVWSNDNATQVLEKDQIKNLTIGHLIPLVKNYLLLDKVMLTLDIEKLGEHIVLIFKKLSDKSVFNIAQYQLAATFINHPNLTHLFKFFANVSNEQSDICLSIAQKSQQHELVIFSSLSNSRFVGCALDDADLQEQLPIQTDIEFADTKLCTLHYGAFSPKLLPQVSEFLVQAAINHICLTTLDYQGALLKTDHLITQTQSHASFIVNKSGHILDFRAGEFNIKQNESLIGRGFLSLLTRESVKTIIDQNIKKFGIKRRDKFSNLIIETDVVGSTCFPAHTNSNTLGKRPININIKAIKDGLYLCQICPRRTIGKDQHTSSNSDNSLALLPLLNTSLALIKLGNFTLELILTSDSFNETFHFKSKTLPLFKVLRCIHRQHFVRFKAAWYAARAGKDSFKWSGKITIAGKSKWIEMGCADVSALYEGHPCYFYFTDISAQVVQTTKVNELESQLNLANKGAGIGTWRYNYENDNTEWDETMYQLLGIAKHDSRDKIDILKDILHPHDIAGTFEALDCSLANKQNINYVNRIKHQDGTYRYIKTIASYHHDYTQRQSWFLGVCWDITDIKQAQVQAEQANLQKERFLANMSHELKTPLNGIVSALAQLKCCEMSKKEQSFHNVAERSAQQMNALIDNILTYSNIKANGVKLHLTKVNLPALFEELYTSLIPLAISNGNVLKFECRQDLPEVVTIDYQKLMRIIKTLIRNACKFTENGLVVFSCQYQQDTQLLNLQVTDTGCGIDPDSLHLIFEPFAQEDMSTQKDYSGTGLGLAILKEYVTSVKGQINVQSTKGSGTTFFISIPRVIAPTSTSNFAQPIQVLALGNSEIVEQACNASTQLTIKKLTQRDEVSDTTLEKSNVIFIDALHVNNKAKVQALAKRTDNMIYYLTNDPLSVDFEEKNIKPTPPIELILKHKILSQQNKSRVIKNDTTKKTVLIVEDNPLNQMLTKNIVKNDFGEIYIAKNGEEALALAAKHHIDIILMDCQMPIMDGFEATTLLRQEEKYKNTPILALTANTFDEDKQKCFDVGMDDFISKPIDAALLRRKMREWIEGQHIDTVRVKN